MRYKGCAPRVADAARFARAKNTTKYEGGRKKEPMIRN